MSPAELRWAQEVLEVQMEEKQIILVSWGNSIRKAAGTAPHVLMIMRSLSHL